MASRAPGERPSMDPGNDRTGVDGAIARNKSATMRASRNGRAPRIAAGGHPGQIHAGAKILARPAQQNPRIRGVVAPPDPVVAVGPDQLAIQCIAFLRTIEGDCDEAWAARYSAGPWSINFDFHPQKCGRYVLPCGSALSASVRLRPGSGVAGIKRAQVGKFITLDFAPTHHARELPCAADSHSAAAHQVNHQHHQRNHQQHMYDPPATCRLKPSSHKISSTTKIVQSIYFSLAH